jgi:hypothetical protein
MTESHLPVQRHQAFRLDGSRRCLRDSKLVRGAPQKRRVTDRLSGGQEEEPTRVEWEPRKPPAEALLDPRGQRQGRRQVESARELRGSQPAWELQQSKRVAAGLGNDALENGFVQPSREHGFQERPSIPAAQRIDRELRKAEQATSNAASRKREGDPLREQPTRDEGERCARCVIEPLRVVDDAQERALVGLFGEEAENGESNHERARWAARAQAERHGQRVTLRVGKTLDEFEERRAEVLQRCVVELGLPLDARSPDDTKVLGRVERVLEQRRLANPWVALQHEDTAATFSRRLQQPLEDRLLALSAEQLPGLRAHDHSGSMSPRPSTKDFLDSITGR